jgi:hypothetical protein
MILKLNVIEEDFNMRAIYLISLIENFCRINQLDISKIYKKMADVYQDTYGTNIDTTMHEAGYCDMPFYLEKLNIVERYVEILNGLEKMIKNNWDLELDKI